MARHGHAHGAEPGLHGDHHLLAIQLPDGPRDLAPARGPSWAGLGIWAIRPDGRALHRVVAGGGSPAYSPDGHWIVFAWNRDGNQELYTVRADGSGLVQLTNTYGITEGAPGWQPLP